MALRELSDELLIKEVRGRRLLYEGVGILCERHGPIVKRIMYKFFRNDMVADDYTQQFFMALPRKLKTFDTTREFKPWLCVLAFNYAIDRARIKKVEIVSFNDNILDEEQIVKSHYFNTLINPEDKLMIEERNRMVQEVLDSLAPKDSMLLKQRYWENKRDRELAEIYGLNDSTFRSRKFHAKRRARKAFLAHPYFKDYAI